MNSNKGITMVSLVIYIVVTSIIIGTMAMVSSFFFSNTQLIKNQERYAVEYHKFNMFFINDVKNNKNVRVEGNQVIFEDGTTYIYNEQKQAIYRNDTKIAEEIISVSFSTDIYEVENTRKNLIRANLSIGKQYNFDKEIEYVLKYW